MSIVGCGTQIVFLLIVSRSSQNKSMTIIATWTRRTVGSVLDESDPAESKSLTQRQTDTLSYESKAGLEHEGALR